MRVNVFNHTGSSLATMEYKTTYGLSNKQCQWTLSEKETENCAVNIEKYEMKRCKERKKKDEKMHNDCW